MTDVVEITEDFSAGITPWTITRGNFSFVSNQVTAGGGGGTFPILCKHDTALSDATNQYAEIDVVSGADNWFVGLYLCGNSGSNPEGYGGMVREGTRTTTISRLDATGDWINLESTTSNSHSKPYRVRFERDGNTLNLYVDGVLKLTHTLASAGYTGTTVGIIAHTMGSAVGDNFEAGTLGAAGDTTAPILSSPTGTATGQTTASGTVSTDEGNGTLDAVVTTSSTTPSAAQIQAGQDHTGSAAVATDLNNTVSATGSQSVSFTGLTAGTTYYVHYVHEDAAGNVSTPVSSASFTTDAVRVGFNLPSSGVIYDGNADTQVANDTDCTLLAWNSATLPGAGAGAPDVILTGLDLTSGVIEVDLSGESPAPSIGDNYSGFVYWTRADSSVPAFRFINAQIVDLDA